MRDKRVSMAMHPNVRIRRANRKPPDPCFLQCINVMGSSDLTIGECWPFSGPLTVGRGSNRLSEVSAGTLGIDGGLGDFHGEP